MITTNGRGQVLVTSVSNSTRTKIFFKDILKGKQEYCLINYKFTKRNDVEFSIENGDKTDFMSIMTAEEYMEILETAYGENRA